MSADVLRLIALELEMRDLLNFCISNKSTYNKICNETFWRMKLDRDFPQLWQNLTHRENSYKKLYLFLRSVLTEENLLNIIQKPYKASEMSGYRFDDFKDLYDLLYNTGDDHEFGWISYPKDENLEILRTFNLLNSILAEIIPYGYHTRSAVIDLIKNDLLDFYNDFTIEFDFNTPFEDRLITVEERLQKYIIDNTDKDIRQQIKNNQEEEVENISEEGLYNNKEIEFLQILHDAIRIGKLSIFDPIIDYEDLMNKLQK